MSREPETKTLSPEDQTIHFSMPHQASGQKLNIFFQNIGFLPFCLNDDYLPRGYTRAPLLANYLTAGGFYDRVICTANPLPDKLAKGTLYLTKSIDHHQNKLIITSHSFGKQPEQLSAEDTEKLTKLISSECKQNFFASISETDLEPDLELTSKQQPKIVQKITTLCGPKIILVTENFPLLSGRDALNDEMKRKGYKRLDHNLGIRNGLAIFVKENFGDTSIRVRNNIFIPHRFADRHWGDETLAGQKGFLISQIRVGRRVLTVINTHLTAGGAINKTEAMKKYGRTGEMRDRQIERIMLYAKHLDKANHTSYYNNFNGEIIKLKSAGTIFIGDVNQPFDFVTDAEDPTRLIPEVGVSYAHWDLPDRKQERIPTQAYRKGTVKYPSWMQLLQEYQAIVPWNLIIKRIDPHTQNRKVKIKDHKNVESKSGEIKQELKQELVTETKEQQASEVLRIYWQDAKGQRQEGLLTKEIIQQCVEQGVFSGTDIPERLIKALNKQFGRIKPLSAAEVEEFILGHDNDPGKIIDTTFYSGAIDVNPPCSTIVSPHRLSDHRGLLVTFDQSVFSPGKPENDNQLLFSKLVKIKVTYLEKLQNRNWIANWFRNEKETDRRIIAINRLIENLELHIDDTQPVFIKLMLDELNKAICLINIDHNEQGVISNLLTRSDLAKLLRNFHQRLVNEVAEMEGLSTSVISIQSQHDHKAEFKSSMHQSPVNEQKKEMKFGLSAESAQRNLIAALTKIKDNELNRALSYRTFKLFSHKRCHHQHIIHLEKIIAEIKSPHLTKYGEYNKPFSKWDRTDFINYVKTVFQRANDGTIAVGSELERDLRTLREGLFPEDSLDSSPSESKSTDTSPTSTQSETLSPLL